MEEKEAQVRRVRRLLSSERKKAKGRRPRYSDEVRRAVELATSAEVPRGEVASALGLGWTSLQSWIMAEKGRVRAPRSVKAKAKKPGLQRISLKPAMAESALVVVFPSGAEMRGLSLDQLKALLRGEA